MDINLQNAYVEVVLENFLSVVKQNLLFQAQLEVNKKNTDELNDARRQLEDLSKRNVELQHHLETPQINPLKEEKNRLQSALNEMMRENKSLKDSNSTLTTSLVDLNRYVEEMEKVVPVSKLKKLKTAESNKVPEEEINVSLGGTF